MALTPVARIVLPLCLTTAVLFSCGGDEQSVGETELPVSEVLMNPEPGREVELEGEATPAGKAGFILSQPDPSGASIFVAAPASVSRQLNHFETVRVEATVGLLSEAQVQRIDAGLPPYDEGGENAYDRAIGDTHIVEGAPYLDLVRLSDKAS